MGLGTSGGGMMMQNISAGAQFGQAITSGDPLAIADTGMKYVDVAKTTLNSSKTKTSEKLEKPKTPENLEYFEDLEAPETPIDESKDTLGGEGSIDSDEGSVEDKHVQELVKAQLFNMNTGECLTVQCNPKEFIITDSAVFSDIPGQNDQPSSFSFMFNRSTRFDTTLFFDTSEEGNSVRKYVDKFLEFQDCVVDKETGRLNDPYIKLVWGDFELNCIIADVVILFTKFLPDGTPIRATADVVMFEKAIKTLDTADKSSH